MIRIVTWTTNRSPYKRVRHVTQNRFGALVFGIDPHAAFSDLRTVGTANDPYRYLDDQSIPVQKSSTCHAESLRRSCVRDRSSRRLLRIRSGALSFRSSDL